MIKNLFSPKQALFMIASCLLFLLPLIMAWTGETNLPPQINSARYAMMGIFAVIFVFFNLWLSDVYKTQKINYQSWLFWAFLGILLCFSPPIFSGDLHYYLMRGRILGIYHLSPYIHVPNEFPNDLLRSLDTTPFKTDPYGPLSVYFQTLPVLVFRDQLHWLIWGYKFLLLCLFGVSVKCFKDIVEDSGSKDKAYLWALYAFSPFIFIYLAIDGHNDIAMMSLTVIAVRQLFKKEFFGAFLFLILACLFKYLAVITLSFFIIYTFRTLGAKAISKLFMYFLMGLGLTFVLYFPIWGGVKTFATVSSAADWFYNSSMPYVFWKISHLAGLPLTEKAVKYIFLVPYGAVYGYLIWAYAQSKAPNTTLFFRCLCLTYAGFYLSITSPMMPWYWFWMFPWLILSRWPKEQLLVTLISMVGLMFFYKRPNYLLCIALVIYFAAIWINQGLLWYQTKFPSPLQK